MENRMREITGIIAAEGDYRMELEELKKVMNNTHETEPRGTFTNTCISLFSIICC